jgi:hypothetical protein
MLWFQQNKTLQTGFTKGMERLLGTTEAAKRTEQDANELLETDHTGKSDRPDSHDRYDVEAADLQDEVEGNNRARQRYQRLFWESVAEGEVRGLEQFLPVVVEDYSRNRSCPMFSRPNAVLPWRVRNLEARRPSLNVRRVDLPSCSLMSAMLSSTRRRKNDEKAKVLEDPR